jgi:LuxR family transcriptional regulator, maltose regulon positive regulatory protein
MTKNSLIMKNDFFVKGSEALSVGDWEKAKEFLEKALNKEASAEVYENLAWVNWWLNDAPAVFEYRTKAYNLFLEKNDKLGASRTASWLGLDYLDYKGEFAVATGWFQRAENLLEGTADSWELGFIKILKARLAYEVDKNIELAFKLIDETRELSKSLKSIDGEMIAGALKGFILVLEGKVSEGMPLLDEATLLAVTSEDADIKFTTITCCYLIDACERIRDYERAGQWCSTVKELCKRWNYKEMFASCRMKYAGVLMWRGDWKEAEDELLSASSDLQEIRPLNVNAAMVRLADLKRRQGKWNEAEELLNKTESHPLKLLFLAYLCYDKGDYENALVSAEKYLRRFPVNRKAERTTCVELLIRIYLKLGKLKEAKTLLDELRDISNSINTLPIKAALLSAEGIFNLITNKLNEAKNYLEDSVDIYDDIKSPFESSRTRLILAEVLIKLNLLTQAEAELNEAMATFKELGAEKDFEKAKSLLKSLYKDKADEIDKNKYEFTGRELEVLKLIAEGRNNEDIAEKLFLSVRTVEKHITNIYSKLGVTGKSARAYAASYAIKNKLILS